MTDEAPKRRPFHETIVDAIGRLSSIYYPGDFVQLAELIKGTQIPEGHEAIAAAWLQQNKKLHAVWGKVWDEDDYLGVVVDLLEQKKEAEEKAAKKAEREAIPAEIIGRYLLASVELTDQDIDRIWNALPGQARVELQAEALAKVADQRARV